MSRTNILLIALVPVSFVGLLLSYLWARLVYYYYRYEVADDGFRKLFGVISRNQVIIPYNHIQNVDIYRGVLERIFGLANIQIQTAGRSTSFGAEGSVSGIEVQQAEQLRDAVIQRAQTDQTVLSGV